MMKERSIFMIWSSFFKLLNFFKCSISIFPFLGSWLLFLLYYKWTVQLSRKDWHIFGTLKIQKMCQSFLKFFCQSSKFREILKMCQSFRCQSFRDSCMNMILYIHDFRLYKIEEILIWLIQHFDWVSPNYNSVSLLNHYW